MQNILEVKTDSINLEVNDYVNFNDLDKIFKTAKRSRGTDPDHIKNVTVYQIEQDDTVYTFICVECEEYGAKYKLIYKSTDNDSKGII